MRPPRQHPRLRSPQRQPPHPGRHRHQSPRHQRPPRTSNVLVSRHPATNLARLIPAVNVSISSGCHPEGSKPIRASESACEVEGSLPASRAVGLARSFYQTPRVDCARVERRAAVEVAVASARVERTLLSVAFDVDLDVDRLTRTLPFRASPPPPSCALHSPAPGVQRDAEREG